MLMVPIILWSAQNLFFYAEMTFKSSFVRSFFAVASAAAGVGLAFVGFWNGSDWWFASLAVLAMVLSAVTAVFGVGGMSSDAKAREWLGLQVLVLIGATYGLLGAVNLYVSVNRQQYVLFGVALFAFLLHKKISTLIKEFSPMPHALPDSKDLPTVSVLIPARNEDHALKPCLDSIIQSDYEKMEILVLDDCSHDRTPELIRSFAHEGVRFVQGKPTPEDWLGKNYALQQLVESAHGELFLLCDVDVHIEPHTISQLVATHLARKVDFISVQPQYRIQNTATALLAPSRLFWRTLASVFEKNRAIAFSPLQLIKKEVLEQTNNFTALKNRYNYHRFLALNAKKSLALVSNELFGVTLAKRPQSYIENQIRAGYPFVGQTLFWVTVGLSVYSLLFVYPLLIFATTRSILALLVFIAMHVAYGRISQLELARVWWIALLLSPFKFAFEVMLFVVSTVRYLLGKIYWKQRNICLPALQVHKSLPKL